MSALAYHRMPGPGDLPGLGSAYSHNDPAADEPAFGLDDAAGNVGERLAEAGDAGELVETLAESADSLRWIASNADLPAHHLRQFRALLATAERLERDVSAEYQALNGGGR